MLKKVSLSILNPLTSPRSRGTDLLLIFSRCLQLETDDPSEITLDWIDSELGSLAGPSNSATGEGEGGSGTSTPGGGSAPMPKEDKGFARPSRPGRRRG